MTGALVLASVFTSRGMAAESMTMVVTPAAAGAHFVRVSVPLPRGMLGAGDSLKVESTGTEAKPAGVRVVTWYPESTETGSKRTARRAIVSFPWNFADTRPVEFRMTVIQGSKFPENAAPPVEIEVADDQVRLTWPGRDPMELRLDVPPRVAKDGVRHEVVESHSAYRWERFHFDDPNWPRIIETRADAAGGVVVVAHLQRRDPAGDFAPGVSWRMRTRAKNVRFQAGGESGEIEADGWNHGFEKGETATCMIDDSLAIYHPAGPMNRRGGMEWKKTGPGEWNYRYVRCRAEDEVPMQPMSWMRAEIVIGPETAARLTATLSSPHQAKFGPDRWNPLYGEMQLLPELPHVLDRLVKYHQDAVVRSAAVGDDFGNVTGYSDSSPHGGTFGMNRLNHGAAIFEDFRRSGDPRLRETGLAWCDNFYDRSIWWGSDKIGGTRYNNLAANQQKPPNDRYMWRSNDSVSFCTKGYDCFFLAWEETGDPRMLEALQAQVNYAASHLHAYQTTCRNVGDVRDFLNLYEWTGERRYLDEALRLFRELRTRLSRDRLFSEGGDPLEPELPFIEDDQRGHKHSYSKPYIIGYALAGLPDLIAYAPDEPELKETVRAVADFLAGSVDPAGGWRYPHPRSSSVLMSQGIEPAWQLTRAAKVVGPERRWLDAIETVLRARIHGWQRTGMILSGLEGWEISTGKVKNRDELYGMYRKPEDRNPERDYREGRIGYGGAPPEGIVYFAEVLAFYLKHRLVERLLTEPGPEEPLGQILKRSPKESPQVR
ncbi:hypothetical protein GC170_02020 [bacterium]|nr:hypothetical protein [bacterium]